MPSQYKENYLYYAGNKEIKRLRGQLVDDDCSEIHAPPRETF